MPLQTSQSFLISFHSNAKMFFYGDLFLLALFSFILIFYIPHCIQRLRSCRQGFFLQHDSAVIAVPSRPLPGPNIGSSDTSSDQDSMANGKDGLTCSLDATQLPQMKKRRIAFIQCRCDLAGFSVGCAIIWSLYGATLAFLVLYVFGSWAHWVRCDVANSLRVCLRDEEQCICASHWRWVY